jgi:penicillin amidase
MSGSDFAWLLILWIVAIPGVAAADTNPALDVYAIPQQRVQIADGRTMNLYCQGSGSPTVILEAGAGGSTLEWRWVQRDIARITRVCAYDRAGMGFSDPGPLPRTAGAVVADFSALLWAAKIPPPYVLVSHSLGSYFVRLYADLHPEDVVGMVLIDPSMEYQDSRFGKVSPKFADLLRKEEAVARECLRLAEAGKLTADAPIFKECTYDYSPDPAFSPALAQVQIKRRLSVAFRSALLSEIHEMEPADSRELQAARRTYGTMPLIVLTQSPETPEAYPGLSVQQVDSMNRLWMQMHDELAALSTRGSNRLVNNSGHYIQKDRPDVVIGAVREVVDAAHIALPVDGLRAPAKIVVDHSGIPHIYAASIRDAYFVQGFNAARDRLWQTDLWRKRGLGLLAKSLGPAYVEQDRAARLFLYRGDMDNEWAAYAPGARDVAEAFVAGINAFVAAVQRGDQPLPVEFKLTGSTPDTWSADDVVRIRSHGLIGNLGSEVERAQVACLAGLEADGLRSKLEPAHVTRIPSGLDPCVVPKDVLKDYELGTGAVRFNRAAGPAPEGSNNWVIAPSHSTTGRPVLANDPHRLLSIPSLRYIVHLDAPGLSLIGAGEPALPGVSFGHNGRAAFGLTIFEVDQEDLYVYALKPGAPDSYRYGRGWEPMRVVDETIEVKGAPARRVQLRFTRHGPVIRLDEKAGRAFAVRSVWSDPGTAPYFNSTWMPGIQSWDQFLRMRDRWGGPPLNYVYADVQGNIGWAPGARVPVRPNWDGLLPVPGDGRYEWRGFLSGKQLPAQYNPAKGWFATANEMNLPAGYPAQQRKISFEWANRSRIDRIESVLGGRAKLSLDDSLALQTDSHNSLSGSLISLLAPLTSNDPLVAQSLALLRSWDRDETATSTAATVYQVWTTRYLRPMTVRRVTPAAVHELIGAGPLDAVIDYLKKPDARLGPDPRHARDELLLDSLGKAVAELKQRFGPDISTWHWGRLHQMTFAPAVAKLADPQLRTELALPPVELPGSSESPRAASFDEESFAVEAGASVRMVLDVGEWDRSMAINAPGQSGDPSSTHYGDLLAPWAQGHYVPLLFSRAAVEGATERVIYLVPR